MVKENIIINFDNCELSGLMYGGMAGRKEGIIYDDEYWIIKYPDNLKERNLKNVEESYGNNSISEYIGSHVFELANIPVHKTLLGKRNNKLVVACRDDIGFYNRLVEFREYKVSYIPHFINSDGDITNGTGMGINEALECINDHPVLSKVEHTKERFWEMFIIDALNGNPDRNNGNWGCKLNPIDKSTTLYDVYDNGNCLYFRYSENQMIDVLNDMSKLKQLAINGITSRFVNKNHKINPFKYMKEINDPTFKEVLNRICSTLKLESIYELLDNTLMDCTRKEFYKELYKYRLEELNSINYNPIELLKFRKN